MARACLLLASVLVSLALAEVGVRTLLVRSDGFAPTLSSQRWFELYWKPVNRFGLRDPEYDAEALAATRNVFLVGDSFAAGSGIREIQDRCAGVLQRRLGPGWSVLTVARPGWQTADQLNALQQLPFEPDVVVLLYFVNDVLGAAARYGLMLDIAQLRRIEPAWIEPLVARSHLANFFYWRTWRRMHREEVGRIYRELLDQAFFRHDIWRAHTVELRELLHYAERQQAAFVAVVTPLLVDVTGSRRYTSRVVDFFEAEGVPVIDLASRLEGRDPEELVVNSQNHHANERTHAEIAELIYALLAGDRSLEIGGAPPTH